MSYKLLFIFSFLLASTHLMGQSLSPESFSKELEALAEEKKGLNDPVRLDLSGLTLYDFITTLAEEQKLNVSVEPNLNQLVTNNFFDLSTKDILVFLVKQHKLDVEIINNIIVFQKRKEAPVVEKPKPLKEIDVSYNNRNDFLSVKLKNDSLPRVAQAITDVSQKNIVLSPEVKTQKVSAYILNRPFDQVIEMMVKSNNLDFTKDENDNYYLEKSSITTTPVKTTSRNTRRGKSQGNTAKGESGSFSIDVSNKGFLNIKAFEGDAAEMVIEAAEKLNINFFMYNTPEGVSTTLIANGITFDDLLDHLFKGEKYTYKKRQDVYFIGEHTTQGLRVTELIQLENRTIETVLASMPTSVTKDLEVKEFIELNGFVVSGSKINIQEFKDFIYEIDRVVPVVQIEVIIVQYNKSYEIQTGLQAGIDSNERTTSGVLFPSANVNLNANSVNSLIDAFNGLGFINLGKVTQQFYLNLSALENNSIIKIASTPKLVTLNGHQATSSIGETSYYFEQNNRLINTGITDNVLQSGTWKSTEANLSINIAPTVSEDENVTLNLSVERSSFLGRVGETAPPGKATQRFESMIRVKNNEMVLLGGLDELENENSGTGTPFISRVPILKWFFSGRKKRKEKSKLHIFIKPTIIY